MAINSVNFGAEQERQKQGSGILLPTVGVLGGGAVGLGLAMTKPQLDADTFTKALQENSDKYTSNLTADEQKLVDDAKKELKSTNNSSAPATNSDAKPAAEKTVANAESTAPKADVSGKKSLVAEMTPEEIFKKDAELAPKEYLQRKYGFDTVEELQNRVKQSNEEFFSHETANLKKGIESGKAKEKLVGVFNQKNQKALALGSEIENLEIKIKEETYKQAQMKSDSREFKAAQSKIDGLNKSLEAKNESFEKLGDDIDDLVKKIGENKINDTIDFSTFDEKFEKKLEKANSDGGAIGQAKKAAKDKVIAEIEKAAEKEAFEDIRKINKNRKALPQLSETEVNTCIKNAQKKAVESHQWAINNLQKSLDDINKDNSVPKKLTQKGKEAELAKFKNARQAKIAELGAAIKAEKAIHIKQIKDEAAIRVQAKIKSRNLPMNKNEVKDFIKQAKEKAVTYEDSKQKIAQAEEIAAARKANEIAKKETGKFLSNTSERLTQESKKWVGNQREYEKMVAARQELSNDLALVQNARKNNTKITAKLAEEAIPAHGKVSESVAKAADKAAETLSNISEAAKKAVTKAYDAIKAKLPKNDFKSSWKKGAIFAAIGLGVGLVFKLIADGSSSKSAE